MQAVLKSKVAAAVVHEVMRLNPAVPFTFRKAMEDTSVAGVAVPKGTVVHLNFTDHIKGMGTGSAAFNPQQWLDAGTDPLRGPEEDGNMTWGGGSRKCPAQHLATVELIVMAMAIGREIGSIEIDEENLNLDFASSFPHPTGLPATFTARA